MLTMHWLSAGAPERAVPYARRAADEAFAALDFDRAAKLLELILTRATLPPEFAPLAAHPRCGT